MLPSYHKLPTLSYYGQPRCKRKYWRQYDGKSLLEDNPLLFCADVKALSLGSGAPRNCKIKPIGQKPQEL